MKAIIFNSKVLIFAIIASLIGLVILQASWLNKSIVTNERMYYQTLDIATRNAAELYRGKPGLPESIHREIVSGATNKELIHNEMKQIIDSAFQGYNLPLTYKYGIYKRNDGGIHELVAGNAEILTQDEVVDTQNAPKRFAWTQLTYNMGYEAGNDYHLAVYPSIISLIIIQVKLTLFLSIFFIVLILLGFYYLIKTLNQQKQLLEMKNDFINNLTHEFKTPIFSISLASKSLRKSIGAETSDPKFSFLDVIDEEGERLRQQVDRILQLSLLENRKIELATSRINLHDLITEVADSFSLILQEKEGAISLDFATNNPIITGDELHLRGVFRNLIDNALKYTEKPPRIVIKTYDSLEGFMSVAIADNGIGLSKEKQKRIFDKFYRVSTGNVYNTRGFGVGLSYVKEIVALHYGEITVESQENEGSVFSIKLPSHG